jgi:hypothetical protein
MVKERTARKVYLSLQGRKLLIYFAWKRDSYLGYNRHLANFYLKFQRENDMQWQWYS